MIDNTQGATPLQNADDEELKKILDEERQEVGQDLEEVEGDTHTPPRPSEDGDADMDADERGGDQHRHDTW